MTAKHFCDGFTKRLLSMILAVIMTVGLFPITALAEENLGTVHVTIENTTITEGNYWKGILVDKDVPITSQSTMISCVVEALGEYSQTGAEDNYITEINGLSAGALGVVGSYDGWMMALNDWFTNEGAGAYTVSDGTLMAGDKIKVFYSLNSGADYGGTWENDNKAIKSISFSAGELDRTFSSTDKAEYTLTLPEGTETITVTPTAENKNFQVRMKLGEGNYMRFGAATFAVPTEATVLTVTCGDPSWPSMNGGEWGTADSVPAESYTIRIVEKSDAEKVVDLIATIGTVTLESEEAITAARTAYDALGEDDKNLVTNFETLTAAEAELASLKAISAVEALISAIGTVSLESEEAIATARTAFDALGEEEKALVSNYQTLVDAQNVLELLKNGAQPVSITVSSGQVAKLFSYTDSDGETDLLTDATHSGNTYSTYLPVGDYRLEVYSSDLFVGSLKLVVTKDGDTGLGDMQERNEFIVYTASNIYATNSGWVYGDDYTIDLLVTNQAITFNREGKFGTASNGRKTAICFYGDTIKLKLKPVKELHPEYVDTILFKTLTANVSSGLNTKISDSVLVSVKAPKGSTVDMGRFHTYYVYDFYDAVEVNRDDPDYDVFTFPVPNNIDVFHRVRHDDGVTYWNFGKYKTASEITVDESALFINSNEVTKKSVFRNFEKNIYDMPSIMTNANEKGYMNLNVGESFEINAFRSWAAIESFTNAKVAIPDMHYRVIDLETGANSDVVTVTPGDKNDNVAVVTAKKAGTAAVLITYDAITHEQAQTGGAGKKQLSAILPELTGVIVFSVGQDGSAIETNMLINQGLNNTDKIVKLVGDRFDAEHDVLFYTGNEGATYSFTPESGCTVSVARPIIGENSASYNGFSTSGVTKAEDGTFTITGLYDGRNIVKVTKNGRSTYQLITARAASYTIVGADGESLEGKELLPGDTVIVKFNGLFNPAEKQSGVFNFNVNLVLTDGTTLHGERTGGAGIYDFAGNPEKNQTCTVVIPEDFTGENYELRGMIGTNGFGSPIGSMRTSTYKMGKNQNFAAIQVHSFISEIQGVSIPVDNQHTFTTKIDVVDSQTNAPIEATIKVLNSKGETVEPTDGMYALLKGKYTLFAENVNGYNYATKEITLGVEDIENEVEGILTITFKLDKMLATAWDGVTTKAVTPDAQGVYNIGTAEELAWLAAQVNANTDSTVKYDVSLTGDIDLGMKNWTPIGTSSNRYQGTFNGNGFVIRNLYIDSTEQYQALFGALLKNSSTKIIGLGVTGKVTSTAKYVAGIVADMGANSEVSNCYSTVNVTGKGNVGGIAGYTSSNAVITNCYNTGTIKATGSTANDFAAGIASAAASNSVGATISNCYNIGKVSGSSKSTVGPIESRSTKKATNSFYLVGCSSDTKGGGTAKKAEEFKTLHTTLGDAFAEDTKNVNGGYPVLKYGVYTISLPEGFTGASIVSRTSTEPYTFEATDKTKHYSLSATADGEPIEITDNDNGTFTISNITGNVIVTLIEAFDEHTHTPVAVPAVPATCTETGLTEGSVCSICGKVLVKQEEIPATGHHPVLVEVSAKSATKDLAGNKAYSYYACECNADVWYESEDAQLPMTEEEKAAFIEQYMVYAKAEGITISYNDNTLKKGATIPVTIVGGNPENLTLVATVTPAGSNDEVQWSSNKTAIATVDENGEVEVLKAGKATITAKTADGKKSTTVVINAEAAVTAVSFTAETDSLAAGKSFTFKATGDSNATNKAVVWSLDCPEGYEGFVSLSSKGVLKVEKGLMAGFDVKVIATAADGFGAFAEKTVAITPLTTSIMLKNGETEVTGETIKLNLTELSEDAPIQLVTISAFTAPAEANENVTWKSSDKTVLVDEEGNVTLTSLPTKAKTVTLTATADDGSKVKATVKLYLYYLVDAVELSGSDVLATSKSVKLSASAKTNKFDAKGKAIAPTNSGLTWESSNPAVATVSKGTVKGISAGTAVITVSANDESGETATLSITVYPAVSSVTIDELTETDGISLQKDKKGKTTGYALKMPTVTELTLTATADPSDAAQTVSWKSSSTKVATIDPDTGVVTLKAPGTTTITATAMDGTSKKTTTKLTVIQLMETIDINASSTVLAAGKSMTFKPVIGPGSTSDKKVSYELVGGTVDSKGNYSIAGVATLSSSGKLTADKNLSSMASVTVNVTAKDGSETTDSCTVSIYPSAKNVTITLPEENANFTKIVSSKGKVTGYQLNATKQDTLALGAVLEDGDGGNSCAQEVTWKSSSTKIADISAEGIVTAKTKGTVTFTATAADGSGKKDTFKLTVIKTVESVTLENAKVAVGKNITLKPTINPSDANNTKVTWSVVGVLPEGVTFKNGKITVGKKVTPGARITIRATAQGAADGENVFGTSSVLIVPIATSVEITGAPEDSIKVGTMVDLGAKVLPNDTTPSAIKDVTWKSSNEKIATVDSNGWVKAIKKGKVSITATATDGSGKKATVNIMVTM